MAKLKGIKINTFYDECRIEYTIRYSKRDGKFFVVVEEDDRAPQVVYADTSAAAEEAAREWLKTNSKRSWCHVIVFGSNGWIDEDGIDLHQLFRSLNPDGSWVYKDCVNRTQLGKTVHAPYNDKLVIEYTKQRWDVLCAFKSLIDEFGQRLNRLFKEDASALTNRLDSVSGKEPNLIATIVEGNEHEYADTARRDRDQVHVPPAQRRPV